MLVAEYGSKLYLEPWGELPPGFSLPELHQRSESDDRERWQWRALGDARAWLGALQAA